MFQGLGLRTCSKTMALEHVRPWSMIKCLGLGTLSKAMANAKVVEFMAELGPRGEQVATKVYTIVWGIS